MSTRLRVFEAPGYDSRMRRLFPLLFLLTATTALAKENTRTLVDRSIAHAGGWAAWSRVHTVQFRKTIVRFAPDGSVTGTVVQIHRYEMDPEVRMRIESEDKGSKVVLINNGEQAWKIVDGKIATTEADVNSARNSTFGSHYVFGMPFKLLDPGASLADAGTKTLDDGTVVRQVRVTYAKGVGDAGGFHTWTYLIEPKTGRLAANLLLYAAGRYDWTEYHDEKMIGALTLSTLRRGFNADANGKVGPKQSEITYDQIQTNVSFGDDLFAPPR